MKLSRVFLLFGLGLAVASCSTDGSGATAQDESPAADQSPTDEAPPAGTDTTDKDTTATDTVVVDGPNGYTLVVEEFADVVSWSYQSSTVDAKLCGQLETDRTLRIYRSTISPTAEVLCEGGGGSVLDLQAGRELEQPDQDGAIQTSGGDIGTVVSGGDTFGKSTTGTVAVEIIDADDVLLLPATLYIQMTATATQVKFVFSGTPPS